MGFKRRLNKDLLEWKASSSRKPLILRGARQVGKTTLVRDFSDTYDQAILLNLEKPVDHGIFENAEDVKAIRDRLFLSHKIDPKGEILLFIDEIQESPKAIQLLRYFYEELPDLHVIAAGFLLEFAIADVKSFPDGRVQFLYLYPLNFTEYLEAIGHTQACEALSQVPVEDFAHSVLMDLFHQYAIIGGMPEVVQSFIDSEDISTLPSVYESIWETYKEDIGKYSSSEPERRIIRHILEAAPSYLDQRIKFQNFGNSNYRSREVGEAFRKLDDAKVIRLIYPTTSIEPPIQPDLKKSPRMQFLDTGIVNHALGIQADMLQLKDLSQTFKGAVIPHLVSQEFISLNSNVQKKPNFWVREKGTSSAEVDLVFPYKDLLLPVEIKSGETGTLRSLHQFVTKAKHPYAIRMYAGKFKVEEHLTPISKKPYLLMNLPYYLGSKLPEYIQWFVSNH